MKKDIAVIGAGGLGRELIAIIESINDITNEWNILGFYDDTESKSKINGYSVLGKISEIDLIKTNINLAVGIGNPKIKAKILLRLSNSKIKFPSIIHPSVIIYSQKTVTIGRGVVIAANCVLTTNVLVSDFVYINTAVLISHDVHISKYSILMPSVSISTGAKIGEKVYVGNGVKIDVPIRIEDNTRIPAGKIITKDI